jgi:hypothetical protein
MFNSYVKLPEGIILPEELDLNQEKLGSNNI